MRLTATIAVLACGLVATTASAGPLTLNFHGNVAASESSLGSFTGSLTWNPTLSQLTISLTNTSPVANGGYLTAFAFQGIEGLTYSLQTPPTNWAQLAGSVDASPFGEFTLGASTGSGWQGGGPPQNGLAIGQSAQFVFAVGGVANPGSLDAMSFWNQNEEGFFGVVRFRGFEDGGSDKVPMALSVVPVPAPVLLAGLGLVAGVVVRRRMK